MHSCDFTGGAHFRSVNTMEEHAFFDAGTDQLYHNNGLDSDFKLLSIANSKRGFYVSVNIDFGGWAVANDNYDII